MLKVHAEGIKNLDQILVDNPSDSKKLQRLLSDYKNLSSIFDNDPVILGGWPVELLCPESRRDHHDFDLFFHKKPDGSVQNAYKLGYQRKQYKVLVNPEGDIIDPFFRGEWECFVINRLVDENYFLQRSIPLTLEIVNEERIKRDENSFILKASEDGYGINRRDMPDSYNKTKSSLKLELIEIPDKLKVFVPEPRLLILLKSVSHASRGEEKDSKDVRHLIKRYYGDSALNFLISENKFIENCNERFNEWFVSVDYADDMLLKNNLLNGKGTFTSRIKNVIGDTVGIELKMFKNVAELAATILGACYSQSHYFEAGDFYKYLKST
ncbi:MAG: hypothetical protein M1348_03855 [Candidatus Parvarchaeota archaeon]|nr:hypothetical protein [Candidatus Parvarchaeota archaeon]